MAGDTRRSVVILLRQGQVYQWQGRYAEADAVFGNVLSRCRAEAALGAYVSYALQHAGKSAFEQGRDAEAAAHFCEALSLREEDEDVEALESTRLALAVAERHLVTGEGT